MSLLNFVNPMLKKTLKTLKKIASSKYDIFPEFITYTCKYSNSTTRVNVFVC